MKTLFILLGLFLSVNTFGQIADTSAKTKPLDSVADKDALYVIDGVVSKNKLNGIDPHDILSIDILKQDKVSQYFEGGAKNGVVVVVTKQGAVKSYKRKFSTFSRKYKEHLESHQNNDEDIGYVLNGNFLSVKPGERAKQLYEIPDNKIKAVVFTENQYYNGGDSRPYIVIITIKD